MSADSLIGKLKGLKVRDSDGAGQGVSSWRIERNCTVDACLSVVQQEVEALVKELEDRKPKAPSGASYEMDTEWLIFDNCIDIICKRLGGSA